MGTLTRLNAENGSNGTPLTQANMPATVVVVGTGGSATFSTAAAAAVSLGYRFVGASGQQCVARVPGTSSKVQRFRLMFRAVTTPGATRYLHAWRNTQPATAGSFRLTSGLIVQLYNAVGAQLIEGPALTQGTWYELSCVFTVGTTTSNGVITAKVYELGTNTQVGPTMTSAAYNLGTLAVNVWDMAMFDASASTFTLDVDEFRAENDVAAEFGPLGGTYTANQADTATTSDQATAAAVRLRPADDTVATSDQGVSLAARARAAADPLTVTDSTLGTATRSRTAADQLTVSDAMSRTAVRPRGTSDQMLVSDTALRVAARARAGDDQLVAVDQVLVERSGPTAAERSDDAAAIDNLSRTAARARSQHDTASATDAAHATQQRSAEASDELQVADSPSAVLTRHATADDALSADDALELVAERHSVASDWLTVEDLLTVPEPPPPFVPAPPRPARAVLGVRSPRSVVLRGEPGHPAARSVVLDDGLSRTGGTTVGNDRLIVEFSIRARTRLGFDDDGNEVFGWSELLRQIALRWEKRTETDAESGATYVRGELLIANPDDLTITESAMALDVETGEAWRILSVHDHPDSTRMVVERIHG